MKRFVLLVCVLISAQMIAANADMVSYGGSVPLATTNWSSAITIPKFDPTLGILNSIAFELSGNLLGTARFENLDALPSTVTMFLSSQIRMLRPDTSIILVAIPIVATADYVAAFDGILDYGGTSGITYAGLAANKFVTSSSPPPGSDLALFTGLGTIALPVIAIGNSGGNGAGNLRLDFSTAASAEVVVKYYFTPIPEPSTLFALLSGLGGIAGSITLRKKRRA